MMDTTMTALNSHNSPSIHHDSMSHPSEIKSKMPDQPAGHTLPLDDPTNPMNWPLHRKLYTSAAAWFFAFAVAFGLTSYTAGLMGVIAEFKVSMTVAILGFTIYLMGIAFAPIYTPHLSERYGRSLIYLITIPVNLLFHLGVSRSTSISSLLACRFFAGLFGGPSLVLIEGTFADIWIVETTNTYYAFLGLSSYIGAALGPLISGFVVTSRDWRWATYTAMIIGLASWLFGIGMSETYQREIPRRLARFTGKPLNQVPAQSGVTIAEMARITIINPIAQLTTDPIVLFATLYLLLNWGVLFSWFIIVPAVLSMTYNFTLTQSGLAFSSAIIGSVLAAITSIGLDQFFYRKNSIRRKNNMDFPSPLEQRLIPAMIGSLLLPASLFWVGWSSKPNHHYLIPIIGTGVYVYASLLTLISIVPYLFDAYTPAGTLSALTIAAVMRILLGACIPLVIVQMVMGLGGGWALTTFGLIATLFAVMPFTMFFFGKRWRERSKYSPMMNTSNGTNDAMMQHNDEQHIHL